MSVYAGPDYRNYKTASELLSAFPQLAGRDNYYMLYPQGPSSNGVLTWCDMTTDGGGWMMIARSHPSTINYGSTNWGWRGGAIGDVKDFSQAYQLGWFTYFYNNTTFSSFIFGNRGNYYNNTWGYFIYKRFGFTYNDLMNSDTQQGASASTLQSNTSVYGDSGFPGMQSAIGFATSATSSNFYYMRDCCGFAGYGAYPTSMVTTYCGANFYYAGPWCGGSSTDGSGNFLANSYVSNGLTYGGTNQYMIMVK
jgi:hypothetical protein